MKRLIVLAVMVLTFGMTSCAPLKPDVNEDEHVVRTVISRLCGEASKENYYVLSSSSDPVDTLFLPSSIDDGVRRSLVDRNSYSQTLPAIEICSDILRRVDQARLTSEIQAAMQNSPRRTNQWSAFYAKFPNAKGIVRLSLPGYSASGVTAVVQVSIACGDLCKSVSYWVLERAADRWKVIAFIPGPVS